MKRAIPWKARCLVALGTQAEAMSVGPPRFQGCCCEADELDVPLAGKSLRGLCCGMLDDADEVVGVPLRANAGRGDAGVEGRELR